MTHDNCIFCKIIDGDIPSAKVFENEHVFAFLDISQVSKGHTLIIPKQHTRNLYDTTAEVAKHLFEAVPHISNAIKDAYNPVGMNVLNNNEEAASQTVFHLHLHLIPKYENGDGLSTNWITNESAYTSDDLAEIAQTINENILI